MEGVDHNNPEHRDVVPALRMGDKLVFMSELLKVVFFHLAKLHQLEFVTCDMLSRVKSKPNDNF